MTIETKLSTRDIVDRMYTIPKQTKGINEHSLERYFNCIQIQDKKIEKFIEDYKNFKKEIADWEKIERSLIEKGLDSDNVEVQKMAVERIVYTPKNERKSLIEKALDIDNVEVQKMGLQRMTYVNLISTEEKWELIDKVEKMAEDILNNNDYQKIETLAVIVLHISYEKKLKLINKIERMAENILKSNDYEKIKIAIEMMGDISEEKQISLIEKALDIDNFEVQKKAIEMMGNISEEKQISLIEKALDIDNFEVQKKVVRVIDSLYKSEKEKLELINKEKKIIQDILDNNDYKRLPIAAVMLLNLPEEEKLELTNKLKEIVDSILNSDDIEIQQIINKTIWYIHGEERTNLIKKLNPKTIEFLTKPQLYDESKLTKEKFGREDFEKTGSKTTLLGGSLLGESIVRYIKPEAFLDWKRIYENYEIWEKAGFDYVPVEPIQSYALDKKTGLVRVFSGVLDLSLLKWINITTLFNEELEEQRNKIIKILESQKIEHGHPHRGNFTLSFYRNKDGSVNFNKCPRLYVIDFDQSAAYK